MMSLYEHDTMHKHVKFACNKDYFYIVNDAYCLAFKVLFHKKEEKKIYVQSSPGKIKNVSVRVAFIVFTIFL